ncbi:MAG: aspartate--tRNA ligase [Planctomycetes bacterium]|nr:aspartate--tRNA ligase [Planctomycetota bacterium]
MKRTHTCGELRASDIDSTITLCGWVQNRRDHGGVLFIDLRDRYGLTQVVFDPDEVAEYMEQAQALRAEWVVQIVGRVRPRPEGTVNPKMATGEIEVRTEKLEILSHAKTPPFEVDDYTEANEELRLQYRYLDLRRSRMQHSLITRHKALQAVRRSLDEMGFLEIETPILAKSTPEGARDYLVPSRVHPGSFYALPQSPQIFKQILMISGFDKYFQICRCFRDEDLRADRQPEFTQIDLEMSFADPDDIFAVVETVMQDMFKAAIAHDLPIPFPRMAYAEAMEKYGCDKPDLRFGLELQDVSELVKSCDFKVFTGALERGGIVKAIRGPGMCSWSRKQMDDLAKLVAIHGAKGLAYIKLEADGSCGGPVAKFFTAETIAEIAKRVEAVPGDCIMFGADSKNVVNPSLALLRNHLGKALELYDPKKFNFIWITEFPLLEWDEEKKEWASSHHPFTQPLEEDLPLLDQVGDNHDLLIRSSSYDLVLNGVEVASGSIRIHNSDVQEKIFRTLRLTEDEIKERFGFFVNALQYGTPPHAGIAPGFDRLIAMMLGYDNIREVIAFPKTQKATCPMSEAPSPVDEKQMRELSISVRKKPSSKPSEQD